MKKLSLFVLLLLLMHGISYSAEIGEIILYITKHNVEIAEVKKMDSFFSDLKIEAYANGSMSKQEIGLKATIPVYSPREKREKKMEASNKEREVTHDASKLVGLYFSQMRHIENEEILLRSMYNEVQWIGKRVDAGIDYQKEYNEKLHIYIERRRDLEAKKAEAEALIESILAFVPEKNRQELRRMINEAVSKNKKTEKQNLPLPQEGK